MEGWRRCCIFWDVRTLGGDSEIVCRTEIDRFNHMNANSVPLCQNSKFSMTTTQAQSTDMPASLARSESVPVGFNVLLNNDVSTFAVMTQIG